MRRGSKSTIQIGNLYGKLKVKQIKVIGRYKNKKYLVVCICGFEKWVLSSSLLNKNAAPACGSFCRNDYGGRIFNGVRVLNRVNINSPGRKVLMVKAECFCGKEFITKAHNLASNHTKSCGCLVNRKKFSRETATKMPTELYDVNRIFDHAEV